jgi:hypothetical protein
MFVCVCMYVGRCSCEYRCVFREGKELTTSRARGIHLNIRIVLNMEMNECKCVKMCNRNEFDGAAKEESCNSS